MFNVNILKACLCSPQCSKINWGHFTACKPSKWPPICGRPVKCQYPLSEPSLQLDLRAYFFFIIIIIL